MRTTASLLAALLSLSAVAACDDSPGPEADPSTSPSGPACVEVSSGPDTLHLVVPSGFSRDDSPDASLLDQLWSGPDGPAPTRVALDAVEHGDPEDGDPDWKVLQRAATVLTSGHDAGAPEAERAFSRVKDAGGNTLGYTTANRANDGLHRISVTLERSRSSRFVVGVMSPEPDFAELEHEVLASVAEGPCP